jgi:hypothetical protein
MAHFVLAGLLLSTMAAVSAPLEHRLRIDHHSGAIDVLYRGDVAVVTKEVGTVAPGGRPSTLRCTWRLDVALEREARHASGSVMTRSFNTLTALEGSRPGWCMTHRRAIEQDVASRRQEVQQHLLAAAAADRPVLAAEIDRLPRTTQAG